MSTFMVANIILLFLALSSIGNSAPQPPEINDQFEEPNHNETEINIISNVKVEFNNTQPEDTNIKIDDINVPVINNTRKDLFGHVEISNTALLGNVQTPGFMTGFYLALKKPIVEFIETPKVSMVLRNIGTCVVNGAMEIVSFYFPAPLIPLIASAAGMFIPFEPVVLLRNKMPVTSYRRAFNSAVKTFMGTFKRFKTSEEDPYMTRRFNRRFMGSNSKEDGN